MSAIDRAKFIRATEAWEKTSKKLGVRITTPYQLRLEDETINCLGFLPDFGGEKGMIIGAMDLPKTSTDDQVFKFAKNEGLFCSFVNISHYAEIADENVFKEAFNDWGYYGAWENCPSWFNGIKGSKASP